ncbi:MAG: triphosphoribosyl-dephospho-CoA synthase [Promethearchaeota archaeon]
MSSEEIVFSIKSLDDLTRCIILASLLEIAGWPKPGNIHRTKNFENTRFEHFLAGIAAIQPIFRRFCEKIYDHEINSEIDYSFVKLGYFYKKAVKKMMKWQKGGNILLGHILLLAPLAAAASICLKLNITNFRNFVFNLKKVIDNSTVNDTIQLYEAIRLCNPGGLGKIDKYDINNENSKEEIQTDKITLKKIFELSKEYDIISQEYSTGFNIIFNEGLPYFNKIFDQTNDINTTTVNTFLKILSEHPDTLIIRKSGLEAAEMVSNKASEILKNGGISSENGLTLCQELDSALHEQEGKLNPGTTADLVAGVIFCALIFGLRF